MKGGRERGAEGEVKMKGGEGGGGGGGERGERGGERGVEVEVKWGREGGRWWR